MKAMNALLAVCSMLLANNAGASDQSLFVLFEITQDITISTQHHGKEREKTSFLMECAFTDQDDDCRQHNVGIKHLPSNEYQFILYDGETALPAPNAYSLEALQKPVVLLSPEWLEKELPFRNGFAKKMFEKTQDDRFRSYRFRGIKARSIELRAEKIDGLSPRPCSQKQYVWC